MAFYARRPEREYSAAPQGLWSAVCVDLVDKGMARTQWGEYHQLQLRWELNQIDPETSPPRPYMVLKTFRNSMHKKSNLRQFIESWFGKKFRDDDQAYKFDLEKLIGKNCQLSIAHNIASGGEVWANVVAVVGPAQNGIKLQPSANYVRAKDRPQQEGDSRRNHSSAPQQNHQPFDDDPFNDGPMEDAPAQITDEDIPF